MKSYYFTITFPSPSGRLPVKKTLGAQPNLGTQTYLRGFHWFSGEIRTIKLSDKHHVSEADP